MTQAAIMPDWMMERLEGTAQQPGEIELRPDEAISVSLFMALGTQWQRHAMTGLRIGLDYAAIPPAAGMMNIDMTPRRFADLRAMEAAALDVFAERPR